MCVHSFKTHEEERVTRDDEGASRATTRVRHAVPPSLNMAMLLEIIKSIYAPLHVLVYVPVCVRINIYMPANSLHSECNSKGIRTKTAKIHRMNPCCSKKCSSHVWS